MTTPDRLLDLIERFGRNLDSYRSGAYNETQVRREFVDPFFKLLGWDVDNEQGYAEAYKDVIHEDAIQIEGRSKAPDYCFRVGGARKFFVEAKKPSVYIREEIHPAFQLRRYAWSARLPLSVLTDFEEFAVYDCRIKPNRTDRASVARITYCTFGDYPDQWDEIAGVFSKEAVLRGDFDRYIEAARGKRGTAEVDSEFLKEIEGWRDKLARDIALRNRELTQADINYAVQMTIDRLIFLRICEDRGIEPYQHLRDAVKVRGAYQQLCHLFRQADDKYNSGLFHFKAEPGRDYPDELTLNLGIADDTLVGIVRRLYYPDSPYEFSVLGADILGQVYEQFLGKVIRLTPSHLAKVEDKPEVKKAGGVYYTPTYIVDYIVRNTVGKLLEGKSPAEVAHFRILDPACGSGSFLIGAYQLLLDWHRDWYVQDGPDKHQTVLYRAGERDWRLSTAEKKRILLNNLYGVDIDPQAVEVTKLSLMLKVLEGETQETIGTQLRLFQERALPDLANNVRCGNSLIGYDFFQGRKVDDGERARINAFDWPSAFPHVFAAGGFDVVIGNPPWGAQFSNSELSYLRRRYQRVVTRMVDSYIYFIDQAMRLTRDGQMIGVIVPSTILNQVDATALRQILLDRGVSTLVNLGQGIFGVKVLNTSTILVTESHENNQALTVRNLSNLPLQERERALSQPSSVLWEDWEYTVRRDPYLTFFVDEMDKIALFDRLRRGHRSFREILQGTIQRGVTPDVVSAHVVSPDQIESANLERELLRPSISGSQIKRYHPWYSDQYIIYTTRDTPIGDFPNAARFLQGFKHLNTCKEITGGKHPWWALHRPRDMRIFESPKFIGLTTSRTIELIYDADSSLYVTDAMYVFTLLPEHDPWVCMAILQSRMFLFLYRIANQGESRVIPQVKASKLYELPFPTLASTETTASNLSNLCQTMLGLHEQLAAARTPPDRERIERHLAATDRQIDSLVYELYGLTEDETAIVEGRT